MLLKMNLLLLAGGMFLCLNLSAQSEKEVKNVLDDLPAESYFDVNAGLSNGYFTPKSATGNTVSRLFYTAGMGYYDASGFTLSAMGMMTNDNGKFTLYQSSLTPGFDFNKGKKWKGGISYTRYFSKDSVGFYLSPLKNEFYGYLTYKGGFLLPTLAVNYATGTQKDVLTTLRRTITKNTSVHDFSLLVSAKHSFDLGTLFTPDDDFRFEPSVMAITGTNSYGSNLLGTKIPRFTTNKRAARLAAGNTASGNFALQYISVNLDFSYDIGKCYIQPQLLFDYTVPKAESQWNTVFSITAGISF